MTSDEIKQQNMLFPNWRWMQEIAYQLAMLNEKLETGLVTESKKVGFDTEYKTKASWRG